MLCELNEDIRRLETFEMWSVIGWERLAGVSIANKEFLVQERSLIRERRRKQILKIENSIFHLKTC